jgi:hypothetical protein
LCLVANPPANMPSGLMRTEENQIWSPRVKFEAETSKTGGTGLVHIRCCYNNKYWVVREMNRIPWVVASANKPEEDQTKPECTLFRYRSSTSQGTSGFVLQSVTRASNMYVTHLNGAAGGLQLTYNQSPIFPTFNWASLVILPTQVSFRSEVVNDGDNYLCSRVIDRWYNYHRFETDVDIGNQVVAHDLFPTANGNYRIRNLHFGKFWRGVPNWIWADAEANNNSNEVLFSFVKIDEKHIALRSLGNNRYCVPDSREGKRDCLRAETTNIEQRARLMVHERILQRQISGVRYRLSDSRIYGEQLQEVSHAFATNDSPDKESSVTLTYSTTESRTTTWNNSYSVTVGGSVSMEVSFVPFVASGEVTLFAEHSFTHEWGKEQTREEKRESSYTVPVPPLSTMKVTLMCTNAKCDVPFSYKQRDLQTNGQWTEITKDDGIYTGLNSFNFYFQATKV